MNRSKAIDFLDEWAVNKGFSDWDDFCGQTDSHLDYLPEIMEEFDKQMQEWRVCGNCFHDGGCGYQETFEESWEEYERYKIPKLKMIDGCNGFKPKEE